MQYSTELGRRGVGRIRSLPLLALGNESNYIFLYC